MDRKYTEKLICEAETMNAGAWITDSTVTFSVKDYRNEGQWKELTLSGVEFIRRFLMHVPPKRFVRVRHYGLLSFRAKNSKITLCRNLLGSKKYLSSLRNMTTPDMLKTLWNIDICKCSKCGGHLGATQQKKYQPLLI